MSRRDCLHHLATIYWRFGIDPATEIHDQAGRPHRLAAGEPIKRLFGA